MKNECTEKTDKKCDRDLMLAWHMTPLLRARQRCTYSLIGGRAAWLGIAGSGDAWRNWGCPTLACWRQAQHATVESPLSMCTLCW